MEPEDVPEEEVPEELLPAPEEPAALLPELEEELFPQPAMRDTHRAAARPAARARFKVIKKSSFLACFRLICAILTQKQPLCKSQCGLSGPPA